MLVEGQSFTGFFTCLVARSRFCYRSAIARPEFAYATDAVPDTLTTMSDPMKQAFGLVRRPWGVFYLKNKTTGVQTSLQQIAPVQEVHRFAPASPTMTINTR